MTVKFDDLNPLRSWDTEGIATPKIRDFPETGPRFLGLGMYSWSPITHFQNWAIGTQKVETGVKWRHLLPIMMQNASLKVWKNETPLLHINSRRTLENCLARRFAQQFSHVYGEIVVRNSPREAVRVKSYMFDIFGLGRQISHCVRPSWVSSWAWFTWLQRFKLVSGEEIPTPLKSRENAMYFYWMLDWPSSTRFSRWPHTMRNLPREENFTPKFPRTREERLSTPFREAILLSSFLTMCGGLASAAYTRIAFSLLSHWRHFLVDPAL